MTNGIITYRIKENGAGAAKTTWTGPAPVIPRIGEHWTAPGYRFKVADVEHLFNSFGYTDIVIWIDRVF